MPTYQSYNKKINAWVKFDFTKKGIRFFDVKQKLPSTPFKNVKIK